MQRTAPLVLRDSTGGRRESWRQPVLLPGTLPGTDRCIRCIKGSYLCGNVYERLGFDVVPNSTEPRYDIIQAITFGKPEVLLRSARAFRAAAPVDSYVSPEPWDMPGYDSQVIMAAGAFIQGSSIELSADGPIKPPYSVFFQGGLTWYHAKLGHFNVPCRSFWMQA